MLHTRDPDSQASDAAMRAMFAARKRVFVDLLKWDLPVLAGQYELDQFDDEHARYLILADTEQNHLASARLLPTTRPHILADLFRELCEGEPPTGPDIWEITRFCLDPAPKTHERRQARDRLIVALAEYALANRIRSYTGVAEIGWLSQILAFGWRCRPLGTPQQFGNATLAALRIDITPDTIALLAAAGITATLPPMREAA